MDDQIKVLNEVDIKDLFERQADVRHVEAACIGLTVLALAVVASLVKNDLDRVGSFRALLNEGSGLVAFIGFQLAIYGYFLSFRLGWLFWRLIRVRDRMRVRNGWTDDDLSVVYHPGVMRVDRRLLRWVGRGLTSLPIGTGLALLGHWVWIKGSRVFHVLMTNWESL